MRLLFREQELKERTAFQRASREQDASRLRAEKVQFSCFGANFISEVLSEF